MTTTASATSDDIAAGALASYVPHLVDEHQRAGGGSRPLLVPGTLVSADISGFTALSERLAELGNEGAEQLTSLLNQCFTAMIEACERRHGDIIKFGGDALLVLFTGDDHAHHAAIAMAEMHRIVRGDWSTDSASKVSLGISQGAHSGHFGFSFVDSGHIELLVGGPAVSTTVHFEGEAERNQMLVSPFMAALLPDAWLEPPADSGGRPLNGRRILNAEELPPRRLERKQVDGLEHYLADALVDSVLAGVHGEHRQVVIAFIDVADTDTVYERDGGMALHDACVQLTANVKTVAERHSVHLLASDAYVNGTKLIMTAGAPISTDADEDEMLLALHELSAMDNPLPIKAGVNRGHVFVGDLGGPTRRAYTVMGDAVNLAARLMQKAEHGQVVASQDVLDRTTTHFSKVDLEPFMVKGKSMPIQAAIVGQPGEVENEQPHISHAAFIGRDAELTSLTELATDALAGTGSLVEVSGEPGIGKSRLVREVLHRHPELRVLRMRGGHYARNSPFFTVRRLLRRELAIDDAPPDVAGKVLTTWVESNAPDLLPWVPLIAIPVGAEVASTPEVDLLAEQFRRDRLIAVTSDLLVTLLDDPVALLAEDIHLFDTGSLDIYRQLAVRATSLHWFMIATHRSEPGFVRPDAHAITLEPLGDDELASLAESAGVAAGNDADGSALASLAERAGGNPLFLLELVSAFQESGTDELPETVESLVTTRIDRLPAPDRLLLREAAVGGNVVDTKLIAQAFNRGELAQPDRWNQLADFLVPERPNVYRFRQGLYRDVAYSGLSYGRRREAHLAIGSALEERSGSDLVAVAPLLSDHFDRGRDRARAWEYAVLGGEAAQSNYANTEAINLFERALANAATDDAAGRGRVAESLGDVHQLTGDYTAAVTAYQQSRSSLRGMSDAEVRLMRKIGGIRIREGALSQALSWLTRALHELDDVADANVRLTEEAEIALSRSGALHQQGRNGDCAVWAETAERVAELAGDRGARARAYNMLEIAHRTLGRAEEAAAYSDRALEAYAGSGDIVGEANVLNNRGIQAHFSGDWVQAIDDYDRSRVLRRQAGDVVGEALAANNIGEIRCLQNRLDEALELYEFARSQWAAAGSSVGVAYVTANIAMHAARSGDIQRGLELLDEAEALMKQLGVSSLLLEVQRGRVESQLLAGRAVEAMASAEHLLRELRDAHQGDDQIEQQTTLLLGVAQLCAGEEGQAADTLRPLVDDAHAPADRYVRAVGGLAWASLEERLGSDAAATHARADAELAALGVIGEPPLITAILR